MVLDLRKGEFLVNSSALKIKIDQMVYELYGLNEEEIAVIEETMNG